MGWDAWAQRGGVPIAIAGTHSPEYWSLEDLPLREAFQAAARAVRQNAGAGPTWLNEGELSGGCERREFERIFGLRFDETGADGLCWSADELARRARCADWSIPDDERALAAYWTVREFVDTCLQHGLGIGFSW